MRTLTASVVIHGGATIMQEPLWKYRLKRLLFPLDDGVGLVMVNIGIEYEWQLPRCGGTCKNFEHLEAMCPMKLMECPKKKCVNEAELSKGNGPVRSDKHVKDNMGMSSSDTTKTDTPPNSSRKVYHDDNINIDELRAFVVLGFRASTLSTADSYS
ncbi:hypothetical protein Tco_0582836 [Tanacetum coccineum]